MTEKDEQLLKDFIQGRRSASAFAAQFSIDLDTHYTYTLNEVRAAVDSNNAERIEMTIQLIWFAKELSPFTDLLNELLIHPGHCSHQRIAKTLQAIASSSTLPFVREALNSNFDYLRYTCSEDRAIAKWFSWLLCAIGTPEARNMIKEYTLHSNKGIASEMAYRLKSL